MRALLSWIDRLSWVALVIAGGLLALAPFTPEPHLVEKLRMLVNGTLTRPLDIFDLLMHAAPLVLIAVKVAMMIRGRRKAR